VKLFGGMQPQRKTAATKNRHGRRSSGKTGRL
jgi:hypothetical protein